MRPRSSSSRTWTVRSWAERAWIPRTSRRSCRLPRAPGHEPAGRASLAYGAGGVHRGSQRAGARPWLPGFTDGRYPAPGSGAASVAEAEGWLREAGGRVATVTGRYYAMDRDRRWDRTKLAYDAIVHGQADTPHADSGEAAVRAAYERDETDEFIKPTLVGEEGRVRDGDAVIFFNFRPDRARQLTRALGEADFSEFDRGD